MEIQPQTETNRLYYYCKLSTAIEKILPKKQLLLNPIGKTNDPRENKSFVFATENMSDSDISKFKDLNSDISKEIRRDCKMLCFSADCNDLFGYEYSRMWALYGENHLGVCIQLNEEKFIEENHLIITSGVFKRINYVDFKTTQHDIHKVIEFDRIREVKLRNYITQEFRPQNIDYLFFTKNKEWESEQEYRFVYFSEKKDNEYCKINNSLENIFLGIDFNDNYLPSILEHIPGIEIYKLDYTGIRLVPIKIK